MYNSIDTYYKVQSHIYDLTRWSFLFGRAKLFNNLPELSENAVILDLGCGTGYQTKLLKRKYPTAKIIGLDASAAMLKKAQHKIGANVTLLHQHYNAASFKENSFDLVVCSYSLTMMGDIDMLLQNIHNHLKPKGIFAAVDFDYSRCDWFTRWMKVNFVEMSGKVFTLIKTQFPKHHTKRYSAFTGLWCYSVCIAVND